MYKGDLSNEVTKRILVTYEAVTEEILVPKKFMGLVTGTQADRRFDRRLLNQLWRYTDRFPVRLEMVNFGVSQREADARHDRIDQRGMNPFNYSLAYESIEELLIDLPYRPDVLGVLDIPENQARYGGRGLGIDHLERSM